MRNAETILTVIRERGIRGLPLERVYRLLFNRDLYLWAYAKLYPNKGAMTPGSTTETVDGMSLAKIDQLSDDIRHERFRWTPVRRTYIAKKNSTKKRPLGIPTWRDKLLQEVLRTILEAYFEPQFSSLSHGFRPERGCHTALQTIQQTWTGTRWFIEGDIAQYFDTIDHTLLLDILRDQLHDERLLRLLKGLLAAGYMEDWKFHHTLSGAPQGGVLSPLLSNIYLHRFDKWVETTLIPAHTRGDRRRTNLAYQLINGRLYRMRKRGDTKGAKALMKQRRMLPSIDPTDPGYRRLRYIRYADDFLLGFDGPKAEAEEIKRTIKEWLHHNLNLQLSETKTLITHATTEAARFLGYDIASSQYDHKLDHLKRRSVNGDISLPIPASVIETRCARHMQQGVVIHRAELLEETDYSIVNTYQQIYRGLVQYYLPAHNIGWLNKLHWVMRRSLLKTLAAKHNTTLMKMLDKYDSTTTTREGKTLKCLEVRVERQHKPPLVARYGGISLTRQPLAVLDDHPFTFRKGTTELLQRLLADECELCGSQEDVQVHHIRKLADLKVQGRKEKSEWVKHMAARRRKTLVVCHFCHRAIHTGRPTRQKLTA